MTRNAISQLPNGHSFKSVWTYKSGEFRQRISINPREEIPHNLTKPHIASRAEGC
jgi:hypothetical protein